MSAPTFACPTCHPSDEKKRCADCAAPHSEHIDVRVRVDGGVVFRCACECGERFSFTVLISDEFADILMARTPSSQRQERAIGQ